MLQTSVVAARRAVSVPQRQAAARLNAAAAQPSDLDALTERVLAARRLCAGVDGHNGRATLAACATPAAPRGRVRGGAGRGGDEGQPTAHAPSDVTVTLFSYCDAPSLSNLSSVCRALHHPAERPSVIEQAAEISASCRLRAVLEPDGVESSGKQQASTLRRSHAPRDIDDARARGCWRSIGMDTLTAPTPPGGGDGEAAAALRSAIVMPYTAYRCATCASSSRRCSSRPDGSAGRPSSGRWTVRVEGGSGRPDGPEEAHAEEGLRHPHRDASRRRPLPPDAHQYDQQLDYLGYALLERSPQDPPLTLCVGPIKEIIGSHYVHADAKAAAVADGALELRVGKLHHAYRALPPCPEVESSELRWRSSSAFINWRSRPFKLFESITPKDAVDALGASAFSPSTGPADGRPRLARPVGQPAAAHSSTHSGAGSGRPTRPLQPRAEAAAHAAAPVARGHAPRACAQAGARQSTCTRGSRRAHRPARACCRSARAAGSATSAKAWSETPPDTKDMHHCVAGCEFDACEQCVAEHRSSLLLPDDDDDGDDGGFLCVDGS